jgi:hypothetical protein
LLCKIAAPKAISLTYRCCRLNFGTGGRWYTCRIVPQRVFHAAFSSIFMAIPLSWRRVTGFLDTRLVSSIISNTEGSVNFCALQDELVIVGKEAVAAPAAGLVVLGGFKPHTPLKILL